MAFLAWISSASCWASSSDTAPQAKPFQTAAASSDKPYPWRRRDCASDLIGDHARASFVVASAREGDRRPEDVVFWMCCIVPYRARQGKAFTETVFVLDDDVRKCSIEVA